jgi:hypothetical protein
LESAAVIQTTLIHGQSAEPDNTFPKKSTELSTAARTSPSQTTKSQFALSLTVTFFRNLQTISHDCICRQTQTEFNL